MKCNTCGATFDRYEAEWSDGDWTGLKLTCPSCGDLLRTYELEDSETPDPLPAH